MEGIGGSRIAIGVSIVRAELIDARQKKEVIFPASLQTRESYSRISPRSSYQRHMQQMVNGPSEATVLSDSVKSWPRVWERTLSAL